MQNTTLRGFLTALTIVLLLSIFSAGVSAQRNPPMTSVQREGEKEMYYARFLELKRVPTAEHQRLAHKAGKEYLKRFEESNDSDAREVRKFVNQYEKVRREFEFYQTFSAGDNTKTVELGWQILQRHPESFFVKGMPTQTPKQSTTRGERFRFWTPARLPSRIRLRPSTRPAAS